MVSLSRSLLPILVALPLVAGENGFADFHSAGFPTMTLIGGITLIALAIKFGLDNSTDDWKGFNSTLPKGFVVLNLINAIIGIFLLFGPGEPAPKANVIGFQMMVGAAIGFYGIYTNLRAVAQAFFVLTLTTVLSIVGCFPWLNHISGIYTTSKDACTIYFAPTDGEIDRCDDKGYLQLVRTFSLFALLFLTIQLFQSFLTFTDGTRMTPKNSQPTARQPLMNSGYGSHSGNMGSNVSASSDLYVAPSYDHGTAAQQQVQPNYTQVGMSADGPSDALSYHN